MIIPKEREIRKQDLLRQINDVRNTIEHKQGEVMSEVINVKEDNASHFGKIKADGRENERQLDIHNEESFNDAIIRLDGTVDKTLNNLVSIIKGKMKEVDLIVSGAVRSLETTIKIEMESRLIKYQSASKSFIDSNIEFKAVISKQFKEYQKRTEAKFHDAIVKVNKLSFRMNRLTKGLKSKKYIENKLTKSRIQIDRKIRMSDVKIRELEAKIRELKETQY